MPFGEVERAVNAEIAGQQGEGGTTIIENGLMIVAGWAADPQATAPVKRVEVFIDGSKIGNAQLEGLRQDIVDRYPERPDFLPSGWYFIVRLPPLTITTHQVTAVAVGIEKNPGDPERPTLLEPPRTITIAAKPPRPGPALSVIRDTIRQAQGEPQSTTLQITWQPGVTPDGYTIVKGELDSPAPKGVIELHLVPGTYLARIRTGNHSTLWRWTVPIWPPLTPPLKIADLNPQQQP